MIKSFFSFEGRLNRLKYIINSLLVMMAVFVLTIASLAIMKVSPTLGMILTILVSVASFWISFALMAKRWHDMDKSAWMIILSLIPILNIVAFVVLLFFKGTTGSNRYGEDLLQENIQEEV
jgi:uncharacterized membrane protein YhaH (DUF805 family)